MGRFWLLSKGRTEGLFDAAGTEELSPAADVCCVAMPAREKCFRRLFLDRRDSANTDNFFCAKVPCNIGWDRIAEAAIDQKPLSEADR